MKKTLLYILILALLGWAVYYFVFKERSGFAQDEADFQVKDTASVTKIFMADKKGRSVLLERKNGAWLLNNQYPVIQQPVNTLFYTLTRQVAQYPVPEKAYNDVVKMLAGNSVKVELYNKNGDKIKVFYVGGQANDNAGSYMIMEGAETPYVVQIPGFEGYISSRYSTDIADWRDRTVFNAPVEQIKTISVQYPDLPLNSFVLRKNSNDSFMVDVDPALSKGKVLNTRRVSVYSKFFEKVYSEGYINGTIKLDSVISSVPLRCIIEATVQNGNKQRAEIYWMPVNKRSKNILTPFPGIDNQFDADRFYAVINNYKDTVIIQRNTFEKIFRMAYEFYEADDTSKAEPIQVSKAGGNVIKPKSGK